MKQNSKMDITEPVRQLINSSNSQTSTASSSVGSSSSMSSTEFRGISRVKSLTSELETKSSRPSSNLQRSMSSGHQTELRAIATDTKLGVRILPGIPRSSHTMKQKNDKSNAEIASKPHTKRKGKTILPLATVDYLKRWIMSPEHVHHPYPTEIQKLQIMKETGIDAKRLSTWFANNRKRFWKPQVVAMQEQDNAVLSNTPSNPVTVDLKKADNSILDKQKGEISKWKEESEHCGNAGTHSSDNSLISVTESTKPEENSTSSKLISANQDSISIHKRKSIELSLISKPLSPTERLRTKDLDSDCILPHYLEHSNQRIPNTGSLKQEPPKPDILIPESPKRELPISETSNFETSKTTLDTSNPDIPNSEVEKSSKSESSNIEPSNQVSSVIESFKATSSVQRIPVVEKINKGEISKNSQFRQFHEDKSLHSNISEGATHSELKKSIVPKGVSANEQCIHADLTEYENPPESLPRIIRREEYVDIYIMKQKNGASLSIRDVTIIPPKPENESMVLNCYRKCLVSYDYDESLSDDKRKIQSRRDAEIVRIKKQLLQQSLHMHSKGSGIEWARRYHLQAINVVDDDIVTRTSVSPASRLKYIDKLWPTSPPLQEDEDIRDYYGFEIQLTSDEESNLNTVEKNTEPIKGNKPDDEKTQTVDEEEEYAYTQDAWVQCDACQKWRRLPDHVNVAELPTTWYCNMNRWDKKHNRCSIAEEKTSNVSIKSGDFKQFRHRLFTKHFLQRMKNMDKVFNDSKYDDMKSFDGKRSYVTCTECFKKRPLLLGMDPNKIPMPFVCWMNKWDELHSSCTTSEDIDRNDKQSIDKLDECVDNTLKKFNSSRLKSKTLDKNDKSLKTKTKTAVSNRVPNTTKAKRNKDKFAPSRDKNVRSGASALYSSSDESVNTEGSSRSKRKFVDINDSRKINSSKRLKKVR